METVFGEQPRPWVIVVANDPPAELRTAVAGVATTTRFVRREELPVVRQSEYDAAVIIGDSRRLDNHLHVVQFGGMPSARFFASNPSEPGQWRMLKNVVGSRAERFVTGTASVHEGLESLVAKTLIPVPGSEYEVLTWSGSEGSPPLNAFALEKGGRPLAAWVPRENDPAGELWWLPRWALPYARDWIAAAFRRWQREYPDAFPSTDWASDPRWMTRAEVDAEAALRAHATEVAATTGRLHAESERLAALRAKARSESDENERRLLTSQDKELVEEVANVLRELGLDVVDADTLEQHAARKQEDLRVTDGDWVCLVEVKGYAKRNAKTADLLQLGKAVETFIVIEKRPPSARWYVVNQSFSTPPEQRPIPFQGAPELETFASSGGLVIDTRDLFRLREAVRAGDMTKDAARGALKNATGVFNSSTPTEP